MNNLTQIGLNAKNAKRELKKLSTIEKNNMLIKLSQAIEKNRKEIISVNQIDYEQAQKDGIKGAFLDRLKLNDERIAGIKDSLIQLTNLKDPVGEIIGMEKQANGLLIGQKRTSMGVIGIIYEARPNVTADAFGLCFKTSNCVILRGGKEAINTNTLLINIFRQTLKDNGLNENFVQLIEDTDRAVTLEFMKLHDYIDVLIPRGGPSLIKSVMENSTIPVIETGVGNCHTYIDEFAEIQMAKDIAINAKTHRPGVCNACETLLINEKISKEFTPIILNELIKAKVEIRGCEKTLAIAKENGIDNIKKATEEDFYEEYSDMIIAVKIVNDVDEAIDHIEKYSSGHSEAIVTESYTNSTKFLEEVDSAAVYVNASTRFTDGVEFGLGAEIGISTQKLHARGPMGLLALTTTKYIVLGEGQIRK